MPRTVIPETKETIRGVIWLSWLPEAVCRQQKSKHITEVLLNWRDRDQSLLRLRQHHLKRDFTFHIKFPWFLGHKSTDCGSISQLSASVPFTYLSVITSLYVILISLSLQSLMVRYCLSPSLVLFCVFCVSIQFLASVCQFLEKIY